MTVGTLIVKVKKNKKGNIKKEIQLNFTNSRGEYSVKNVQQIPPEQISLALTEKLAEDVRQEIIVIFEEEGDQLLKLRENGTEWDRQEIQLKIRQDAKPNPLATSRQISNSNETIQGDFHNPYNFIPAPIRNKSHTELGDRIPSGHGCYHHNYWSGRISVTLKTITPLLIIDAAKATEDPQNKGHFIYDIRVDAEGKPYLPVTSIKGMLRSAYEAVTNSRFGIFDKHEDRLAYRTPATATPTLFPARVEKQGEKLVLKVMEESGLSNYGYTAKLPRYDKKSSKRDKGESFVALKYEGTKHTPKHGDHVWVKHNAKGKVTNIRPYDNPPKSLYDWKEGWVCITGANINDKMNERVFIVNDEYDFIEITKEHKSLWRELISNYQDTHQKDLEKRDEAGQKYSDYLVNEPGWSRHIGEKDQLELTEGILCYIEFDQKDEIIAIQPVTISRRLYKVSPNELLDDSLKPASSIEQLSPADRVFGWVKADKKSKNHKGATAYKGNLRIFKVICQTDAANAIERFRDNGFPLAILGKPKEQQARFYQAENKEGKPLTNGQKKEQGYSDNSQGLRGRKVYPHHNGLPENHWQNPQDYRPKQLNEHSQEYRQPTGEDEKTDQNRSIKAWVKPNVTFTFTLDVINLSAVELGALLWLLSLEDNHYHRLGLGKPLGFGSVQLSINWNETDLRKGEQWKEYYQSLSLSLIQKPDAKLSKICIDEFKKSVTEAYGKGSDFDNVSFIKAFLVMAKGFEDNLPIHYPRVNPNSKGFDWFVENERVGKGYNLSLPMLAEDKGLPYNSAKE